MAVVRPSSGPIRFGAFEVDPNVGELHKQGVRVKLQEQPLQILLVLLERPGEVVTREELQQRVWPADTFVDFDHGLYNAIKRLREAIGDTADTPRFIETIPRRGYRFIGPVNGNGKPVPVAAGVPPTVEVPAMSRPGLRIGIGVGAVAVVLLLVLLGAIPTNFWRRFSSKDTVPQIHSIAVLPLKSLSDDLSQKYFTSGMTEELITDLSQISALKVISRTSSEIYENTHKKLPEIARELNVDAIVEGSVQRSGNHVRVTAQLIYAPQDKNLWARSYERDLQDALTLQSTLATAIANELRIQVAPDEQARLRARPTVSVSVLDTFLEGNYHLHQLGKGFGDEEPRKAAQFFQRAIDEDPSFASAYIGLARAHGSGLGTSLLRPTPKDYEIRKAALQKAAELDPDSADLHVALADLDCTEWKWAEAEQEFRRAIALNANNADIHDEFDTFLFAMGRRDEGMKEAELAQDLDPNGDHLGGAFIYMPGKIDEALKLLLRDVAIYPEDGFQHFDLFQTYRFMGRHGEAITELEETVKRFGHPEYAAALDHAFANSGWRGAMLVWAAGLEKEQRKGTLYMPGELAETYANIGDKDRAFYWLEDAYRHKYSLGADGGLVWLKANYMPLHSDPRFQDLIRRVGLPQ